MFDEWCAQSSNITWHIIVTLGRVGPRLIRAMQWIERHHVDRRWTVHGEVQVMRDHELIAFGQPAHQCHTLRIAIEALVWLVRPGKEESASAPVEKTRVYTTIAHDTSGSGAELPAQTRDFRIGRAVAVYKISLPLGIILFTAIARPTFHFWGVAPMARPPSQRLLGGGGVYIVYPYPVLQAVQTRAVV